MITGSRLTAGKAGSLRADTAKTCPQQVCIGKLVRTVSRSRGATTSRPVGCQCWLPRPHAEVRLEHASKVPRLRRQQDKKGRAQESTNESGSVIGACSRAWRGYNAQPWRSRVYPASRPQADRVRSRGDQWVSGSILQEEFRGRNEQASPRRDGRGRNVQGISSA